MVNTSSTTLSSVSSVFFSIVIPCYKCSTFIRKTLDTVKDQTFKDLEIVIVDDCSPDNSLYVINQWIFDNKNKNSNLSVKLISHSKNKMQSGARNTGIANSRGEYVALLDHDDLWYPKKLETIYDYIKKTSADWLCHSESLFNLNGANFGVTDPFIPSDHNTPEKRYRYLLFERNPYSPSASCFSKKLLSSLSLEEKVFDEDKNLHSVEDYDLWLRLVKNGHECYPIKEVLGDYLINENSMVITQREKHFKNWLYILNKHYKLLEDKTIKDKFIYNKLIYKRKFQFYRQYNAIKRWING
ncbi:MAG: glycosyltransferase [Oligoflexia bacterium]|nr:glycosyltransferase [Oligoflexia bacterium]